MCKSTQPQRVLALLFVYDSRTRTVSVLACYSTACVLVLARTSKIFYERKLWYTPYVVTCNVCTASILGRYQDTLGFAVFRVSRRLNIEYCVRYSSSRCKFRPMARVFGFRFVSRFLSLPRSQGAPTVEAAVYVDNTLREHALTFTGM